MVHHQSSESGDSSGSSIIWLVWSVKNQRYFTHILENMCLSHFKHYGPLSVSTSAIWQFRSMFTLLERMGPVFKPVWPITSYSICWFIQNENLLKKQQMLGAFIRQKGKSKFLAVLKQLWEMEHLLIWSKCLLYSYFFNGFFVYFNTNQYKGSVNYVNMSFENTL